MFQQIAAFLNVFNPFLLFICTLIWLLVLKVVNKQHDELRHRLRTLEMWVQFNDPLLVRHFHKPEPSECLKETSNSND